MPRQQTAAAERTEQNHRLVERVEAETGQKTTVRKAQQHRRDEAAEAAKSIARYLVVDREVLFPEEDRRRIGQVLGKVMDMKTVRGATVQLTIQTTRDFAHTLTDAALLSVGHPLLITLDELYPPKGPNNE